MDIDYKNLRVISSRLAYMRNIKNLSQKDFATALADYMYQKGGRPNAPSNVSVSQWEIGSKPVPKKYIEAICHVLGCTEAYLYGFTYDPYSSTPDDNETVSQPTPPTPASVEPIPQIYLSKYDGYPVYVEFKKYQHKNGWGILNTGADRLMLMDAVVKLSSLNYNDVAFFPLWEKKTTNAKRLDLGMVLRSKYVYVSMNSPDKSIKDMYNGYYYHNENRTCLINSIGCCLPYDGINISYYVYDKEPDVEI